MYRVPAALTLTDAYDTLTIRPAKATAADPIFCKQWDLGAPDVRVTSTPRVGFDGTYDGAAYTGARTVTFDLSIQGDGNGSPYAYAERLAAFAHPARRPTLNISRATVDGPGGTWTMSLRGNPFSISYGSRAAALLDMQLTFNAPDGYLLSPLRDYTSAVASTSVVGGFTAPETLPLILTPGSGTNPQITLTVGGSAPVAPVIAIYGPVANPRITSGTDEFSFTGLTLGAGEYVVIDMPNGAVYRNGDASDSVYDLVNFATSTFWTFAQGARTVKYLASSGYVRIQFRERRLTI